MPLDRPVTVQPWMEWRYTESNLVARCRIDGKPGLATLTVKAHGKEFPDCLKIKEWAEAWLKDNETTCEEFCAAANHAIGFDTTVEWFSDSHGMITARVYRER